MNREWFVVLPQQRPVLMNAAHSAVVASVDNKTPTILNYQAISNQKQEAIQGE